MNLINFEKKIFPEPNTGCWLWGGCDSRGYGQFGIDGKMQYAHRVSFTIHKGEIPSGLDVLHSCDTPSCVNPDHLFLGTHQENMRDRDLKNRQAKLKGEKSPTHKLKSDQVKNIKRLINEKSFSLTEISIMYGVSLSTISAIKSKTNWSHI